VVIEDILHHKSRLQLKTSSTEEKIDSLRELGKKIPPRHVMMETKIGMPAVIKILKIDFNQLYLYYFFTNPLYDYLLELS